MKKIEITEAILTQGASIIARDEKERIYASKSRKMEQVWI